MTPHAIALASVLIRQHEVLRLAPCRDRHGWWTIGYGSRFNADGERVVGKTLPITEAEAGAMLSATLAGLADRVDRVLPPGATDHQCAALLSFAASESVDALERSRLLVAFQKGDLLTACVQFGAWIYAGGRTSPDLVERRRAERNLFATPDGPEQYDDDPGAERALNDAIQMETNP